MKDYTPKTINAEIQNILAEWAEATAAINAMPVSDKIKRVLHDGAGIHYEAILDRLQGHFDVAMWWIERQGATNEATP